MSEPEKSKPDVPPPRRYTTKCAFRGSNLGPRPSTKATQASDVSATLEEDNSNEPRPDPPIFPENINPFATPNPSDLPFRNESSLKTTSEAAFLSPLAVEGISTSTAADTETGFSFLADPSPSSAISPFNTTLPFSQRPAHLPLTSNLSFTTASTNTSNSKSSSTKAPLTTAVAKSAPSTQPHFNLDPSPSTPFYTDISLISPLSTTTGFSSSAPASQSTFLFPRPEKKNNYNSATAPSTFETGIGNKEPPSATNFTFFDDASSVNPRTERIGMRVAGSKKGKSTIRLGTVPMAIEMLGIAGDETLFRVGSEGNRDGDGDTTPIQSSPSSVAPQSKATKEDNTKDQAPNNTSHRPHLSRGSLFTMNSLSPTEPNTTPPISAVNPAPRPSLPKVRIQNETTELEFGPEVETEAVTITISTTPQATCISIRIPGRERIDISPDNADDGIGTGVSLTN